MILEKRKKKDYGVSLPFNENRDPMAVKYGSIDRGLGSWV